MRQFLRNYGLRHRHRGNQLLHAIGVPLSFPVAISLFFLGHWGYGLIAFLLGYLLQFAGHAWEGNDAGEMILIKRLLKLPYTEFGPPRP